MMLLAAVLTLPLLALATLVIAIQSAVLTCTTTELMLLWALARLAVAVLASIAAAQSTTVLALASTLAAELAASVLPATAETSL